MNAKTLKALKGSIAKWKKIVAGETADGGASDCPLCSLFFFQYCRDCPISEKAGAARCHNTPYQEQWVGVAGEGHKADTPVRRDAASAELRFLKSLLPRKRK